MSTVIDVSGFFISANIDDLIRQAQSDKYEKDTFFAYEESPEMGDVALTEEQFNKNRDDFIAKIKELDEDRLRAIVRSWPRKKNGTFNRKNVKYLCENGNTRYICEWHNTWIYDTVKVTADSDRELSVSFYTKTDTPG